MKRFLIGKDNLILIWGVLVSVLFLFGTIVESLDILLISVLLLFLALVLYVCIDMRGVVFAGFLLTFFVYLLGQYVALWLTGKNWHEKFDYSIMLMTCTCLFLSLIFVFIGFYIASYFTQRGKEKSLASCKTQLFEKHFKRVYEMQNEREYEKRYANNRSLKTVVLILFYITLFFAVAVNLEKAIFVQKNTYLDLYTDFSTQLPYAVHKLAQANALIFCVYLVLLPTRKGLILPATCYFLCSFISLFSGVRGGIVNSTIFLFLYFYYRHLRSRKMKTGEVWISGKIVIPALILLPFVIWFLSLYNQLRNNVDNLYYKGFIEEIVTFFVNQGGSVNILGYTELYIDHFPATNASYLFGPIISLFKYGFWGQLFGSATELTNNTVEMALYGNNLGATLSYIMLPVYYLNGGGVGTQYIAEAYADAGYVGVVLFNILLGILIYKASFVTTNKWFLNAMTTNIILHILRMPRNFGFSFFSDFLSIFNWLVITFIYCATKLLDYWKERKK